MLKEGIYGQVINEDISKKLRDINLDKYILEKEDIDVEKTKTVISNYTSEVIKKALREFTEDDNNMLRIITTTYIEASMRFLINNYVKKYN